MSKPGRNWPAPAARPKLSVHGTSRPQEQVRFMTIPLSWLREYVDVALSVGEVASRLTLAGLEVGSVRSFGLPAPDGLKVEDAGPVWAKDKVVTAQVLKVEKHPNADKLKLVHAEYGTAQPKV